IRPSLCGHDAIPSRMAGTRWEVLARRGHYGSSRVGATGFAHRGVWSRACRARGRIFRLDSPRVFLLCSARQHEGGTTMMKLYWAPQPRAGRAVWMMEEAGAPYERVLVDIRSGAQNTPAYHAVNPMEKVPALTDGDAAVAESSAICAYVADRVPEAGLAPPIGDPSRGRYLHWLFFAAGCIEAAY